MALSLSACSRGPLIRPEVVEVPQREFVKVPKELTSPRPDPERPALRTGSDACLDSTGKPMLCVDQTIELLEAFKRVLRAERCDKAMIGCMQDAPDDINAFMTCFTSLVVTGGLCGADGP